MINCFGVNESSTESESVVLVWERYAMSGLVGLKGKKSRELRVHTMGAPDIIYLVADPKQNILFAQQEDFVDNVGWRNEVDRWFQALAFGVECLMASVV